MYKTFFLFENDRIPPNSEDLESSINIEYNDYIEFKNKQEINFKECL